jgi:hypothetical protein
MGKINILEINENLTKSEYLETVCNIIVNDSIVIKQLSEKEELDEDEIKTLELTKERIKFITEQKNVIDQLPSSVIVNLESSIKKMQDFKNVLTYTPRPNQQVLDNTLKNTRNSNSGIFGKHERVNSNKAIGENIKLLGIVDDTHKYTGESNLSIYNTVPGLPEIQSGNLHELLDIDNEYSVTFEFRMNRFPSKTHQDSGNDHAYNNSMETVTKKYTTRRSDIIEFNYRSTSKAGNKIEFGAIAPYIQLEPRKRVEAKSQKSENRRRSYDNVYSPFAIAACLTHDGNKKTSIYTDHKFELEKWYTVTLNIKRNVELTDEYLARIIKSSEPVKLDEGRKVEAVRYDQLLKIKNSLEEEYIKTDQRITKIRDLIEVIEKGLINGNGLHEKPKSIDEYLLIIKQLYSDNGDPDVGDIKADLLSKLWFAYNDKFSGYNINDGFYSNIIDLRKTIEKIKNRINRLLADSSYTEGEIEGLEDNIKSIELEIGNYMDSYIITGLDENEYSIKSAISELIQNTGFIAEEYLKNAIRSLEWKIDDGLPVYGLDFMNDLRKQSEDKNNIWDRYQDKLRRVKNFRFTGPDNREYTANQINWLRKTIKLASVYSRNDKNIKSQFGIPGEYNVTMKVNGMVENVAIVDNKIWGSGLRKNKRSNGIASSPGFININGNLVSNSESANLIFNELSFEYLESIKSCPHKINSLVYENIDEISNYKRLSNKYVYKLNRGVDFGTVSIDYNSRIIEKYPAEEKAKKADPS